MRRILTYRSAPVIEQIQQFFQHRILLSVAPENVLIISDALYTADRLNPCEI